LIDAIEPLPPEQRAAGAAAFLRSLTAER